MNSLLSCVRVCAVGGNRSWRVVDDVVRRCRRQFFCNNNNKKKTWKMPRRPELCAVEWNQWKGEKQQRDVFLCTLDAILAWLVAIYKKAKQRIVGKKKWKSGIEWKHERPMTTTTQNSFLSFYVFFRMHKIFCLWDRGTGVGEIFCKLKIICIVAIAFCNSIFTLNSLSSQNIRDCSGKRKRKHIHDKREKFYIFALLERNGNRNDRLFRSLFSMVVARFLMLMW